MGRASLLSSVNAKSRRAFVGFNTIGAGWDARTSAAYRMGRRRRFTAEGNAPNKEKYLHISRNVLHADLKV
jgi:hypothetical protein